MSMRWYVVHAYSQYENSVKKALIERIARAGLQDKFGEILVPTEEVVEIKDGVKRITERKFFPGYVLVQMEMNEDTWHLVKSTPKVMGFIGGTPDKPAPISDKEAETHPQPGRASRSRSRVRRRCSSRAKRFASRKARSPISPGVVEEVNYEKNRLRVAVLIFGRSTPVELEFSQVEKG